jgi:hypothetical protein
VGFAFFIPVILPLLPCFAREELGCDGLHEGSVVIAGLHQFIIVK